jgi:hypothetical protein
VRDFEGTLRHLPFFEALGKMDEKDPNWRSISAGLLVLRLFDAWIAEGSTVVDDGSWSLSGVLEAIDAVDQRVPARRILSGIVDAMRSSNGVDLHTVTPRVMAYAQTLEYDTHWALAADIYTAIIEHGHPSEEGDLVVSASIQLGHSLRNIGDLKGASAAYANAAEIARANGDLIGVLRSRIGEAKVATTRGNMPEAEALLDDTIAQATEHELTDVQSRALHDLATVASMRKQYDRAVKFGYQALHLSTAPRERDRILIDIATSFLDLGLLDVARDAYLVLVATAQEQYVRWAAGLNLIDVASRQCMEPMFDRYRRDFDNVELPPYLQASYYLIVGNGYRSFGRPRDAVSYLELAVDVASKNELNRLLFEAEESLAEARVAARRRSEVRVAAEPSAEVLDVAAAIREMRFSVAGSR